VHELLQGVQSTVPCLATKIAGLHLHPGASITMVSVMGDLQYTKVINRSSSPVFQAQLAPVLDDSAVVPPGPADHELVLLPRWDPTLSESHAVVYLADCPTPTDCKLE
jgi:hypothetical protein